MRPDGKTDVGGTDVNVLRPSAGIAPPPAVSVTLPRGRVLRVARAAVVALLIVAFGIVLLSIPLRFARLHTLCASDPCAAGPFLGQFGQLGPEGARTLASRGIPLDRYAAIVVALDLARPVVAFAFALLLVGRRTVEWVALAVALDLLSDGVGNALDTLAATWPRLERVAIARHSFVTTVAVALFMYLLPDGRFVPRWTRWLAVAAVAWYLPGVIAPHSVLDPDRWSPLSPVTSQLVFLGTGLGAQLYRYRRVSDATQRQQTKLIVYGIAITFATLFAVNALAAAFPALDRPGSLASIGLRVVVTGALLIASASLPIAILRYRLFDIDILINRTLVYGALTACVVSTYIVLAVVLGALLNARGNPALALLGTASVAVLFQPLRERLQRGINRLMYGERDDPYAVLSRLGQRLEATIAPDAVLAAIVQTVREALKLPYAAIALNEDGALVAAASSGTPSAIALRLPLVYQHEAVGELSVAVRARGEAFGPTDRRLLDDLARQAGVAAHAVRLTADLRRSRERLVSAREEERRRLRRDLHDGLGPQLGAQMLKVGAARHLIAADPTAAAALLERLETDLQDSLADIRRLVYDLRPPTLDELGLVGAIRESTVPYRIPRGGVTGLAVTFDAPDRLPALPAAVEVAAYRIVQEALTNVARHADARACTIALAVDGAGRALVVAVTDDGVGVPVVRRAGVGLTSMRERATELGGTCTVETPLAGGTRVIARLPLPQSA